MTPALWRDVWALSLEHIGLVLTAVSIAFVIGVPLALWATRMPKLRRPVLGGVSVLQTIPSLALFGFLIPIPFIGGIGPRTAILALVVYALLPIVRNTYTGVMGIDPAVREAAIAMGLSDMQLLWRVELPLAAPTILAGLRLATVTTVGTATIAAAIGGGGLGEFIFRGVATVDGVALLCGAVPAALLALTAEGGIGWIERRFSRE